MRKSVTASSHTRLKGQCWTQMRQLYKLALCFLGAYAAAASIHDYANASWAMFSHHGRGRHLAQAGLPFDPSAASPFLSWLAEVL